MSRRRRGRRTEKARRHAPPARGNQAREIIREAQYVERLAYTRTQAAEALGISRSTLNRLLPVLEIVELPWGTKLIPVDELERVLAERRRTARRPVGTRPPGRPAATPPDIVARIREERAAGKSLRQIAHGLNASCTPTAHGGARWWPSTIRAALRARV